MRTTASLISSLVYGKRFPVFSGEAEVYFEGIKLVNAVNDTTRFPPIEIMPWLTYIPRWLAPVSSFYFFTIIVSSHAISLQWTAHCDHMKAVRDRLYDSLLDECEKKFKLGHGTGSYIENVLKSQEELGLSRGEISCV